MIIFLIVHLANQFLKKGYSVILDRVSALIAIKIFNRVDKKAKKLKIQFFLISIKVFWPKRGLF